jgi:hypothetical protein
MTEITKKTLLDKYAESQEITHVDDICVDALYMDRNSKIVKVLYEGIKNHKIY